MQAEQDPTGNEAHWDQLEEGFFEKGETLSSSEESAIGPAVYADTDLEAPTSRGLNMVQAWLAVLVTKARPWMLWRMRLLQLRLGVAITECAEHAKRAVTFPVLREHALHPFLTRHPRLTHASRLVLATAAVNYSILAVLAVTFNV